MSFARRILVLYPGLRDERSQHMLRHRWRLRLAGVQLLLADDDIRPSDRKAFAGTFQLPAPVDAERAWKALARILDRHPVDAIVAQSEESLLLGARAAREYGFHGPTLDAALATVDKHRSRCLLEVAGVRQPAYRRVRTAHEVRAFARERGCPLVLKAIASSRQRLVTFVPDPRAIDSAVARVTSRLGEARDVRRLQSFAKLEGLELGCDPTRDFLVESFVAGTPLEVDGVVDGRTFHSLGVCEQLPSTARDFFIDGYLLPARLDPPSLRAAEALASTAVRALGLTHTGVSVELRGARDGPRLIEINGRLPWDEGLQELFEAVTGRVPAALALELALGRPIAPVERRGHAALLYRSNYDPARVVSVPSPPQLARLARRCAGAWLYVHEGQQLLEATHPDSQPHLFGVLCTDPLSTDRAREQASAALADVALKLTGPPVAAARAAALERS